MSENRFAISAPGRIVLVGEHLVQYGQYFVSTSLDLRTKLTFCELPNNEDISIDFYKIELNIRVPFKEVQKFFYIKGDEKTNPINVLRYVKYFITRNGLWGTFQQRFSLKIFFFLLYFIACEKKLELRPFHVDLTTELPMNAGLGSSTSFAVCLAACFLHWKRLQDGYQFIDFNGEFKRTVTNYAKLCEEYIQEYECATVDATVCVYGKIVKSQFNNYMEPFKEEQYMTRLNILLIDSNRRQRKCDRAMQMAKRRGTHPEFDVMLPELNISAIKVHEWLSCVEDANILDIREYEHQYALQAVYWKNLQESILESQNLLNKYKLSNKTCEHICSVARENGYEGKLVSYRNSLVYILLPPNITNEAMDVIKTSISHRLLNFAVTSTSINCEGVRIDN